MNYNERTIQVVAGMELMETDRFFIMRGGKFGYHTITATSSKERVAAHWAGYLQNNGVAS
jgi:hypothetical protein